MTDPRAKEIAYIYAFGVPSGPIKIGYSMNPKKRLLMIEKEQGQRLIVMGKWPVGLLKAHAVERYAHWLLRDKHYHGEWFNISLDEAVSAVEKASTELDGIHRYHLIPPVSHAGRVDTRDEGVMVKFPEGTRHRIDMTLGYTAPLSDFVRFAVEKALCEMEAKAPKPKQD